MATKVDKTTDQLELGRLRQELADIKSGTPVHVHLPRDGSASFRCTSPYCDDLGSNFPFGPPPNHEPAERYARRED